MKVADLERGELFIYKDELFSFMYQLPSEKVVVKRFGYFSKGQWFMGSNPYDTVFDPDTHVSRLKQCGH